MTERNEELEKVRGHNLHKGSIKTVRFWGFDNRGQAEHTLDVKIRQDGCIGFVLRFADIDGRQNFHGFEATNEQRKAIAEHLLSYDPVLRTSSWSRSSQLIHSRPRSDSSQRRASLIACSGFLRVRFST